MRWLLVLLLSMMMAAPCQADPYAKYNRIKKFDRYTSAKSGVGAVGLMQIMPRTFEEIQAKNPAIKGNWRHPRWNIAAGIYYDRTLWNLWKAERPRQDRINFMFGSYNAGKGNILKAQKVAEKRGLSPNLWESIGKGNILKAQKVAEKRGLSPNLWESIVSALPKITGKGSHETISYVKKIEHVKGVLK